MIAGALSQCFFSDINIGYFFVAPHKVIALNFFADLFGFWLLYYIAPLKIIAIQH